MNMYLLDIFVCSSKKAQFGFCFLAGFFLAPELHSWPLSLFSDVWFEIFSFSVSFVFSLSFPLLYKTFQ